MIFFAIAITIVMIIFHGIVIESLIDSINGEEWIEVIFYVLLLIALISVDIGLFIMKTKGV